MHIEELIYRAVPILFALTIHEFCHGWVADKLGDHTARWAGRLTLNPLAHLDPWGTLMLIFTPIGWAKPVPVDARNLQNPRQDMIWISLAGPGANMLTGLVCGLIIRYLNITNLNAPVASFTGILVSTIFYLLIISIALAIFNLLPIPPLDGSKILMGILPLEWAYKFSQIERYGFYILIGLIGAGYLFHFPVISILIGPVINLFIFLFTGLNIKIF
jgi:Zn-dependent protease